MIGAIGHGAELSATDLGAMAYGADHASKIPPPFPARAFFHLF
jgi:hypothetical protein